MIKIVCAANKHRAWNTLLLGVSHWDSSMRFQMQMLVAYYPNINIGVNDFIQGFVDNKGNFHDRKQALSIAKKAGQILEKREPKDMLFSEDIY